MAQLWLRSLLRQVWPVSPSVRARRRAVTRRPVIEELEDRRLLSTLQPISLPPANQPPSDTAAGASLLPSVSADGRYVAFQSTAPNLVPGQVTGPGALGTTNVFLKDRTTGAVTLVSHVPGKPTTGTSGGNSGPEQFLLSQPLVSRDGRFVAYATDAPELFRDPSTSLVQPYVVVYDVATGTNTLVSHRAGAPATPDGNGASAVDAISSNGRYVLFDSYANDLVPGQVGPAGDLLDQLYLYDQTTGTTYLVSHAAGQPAVASNASVGYANAVADDGTVAYESQATNLAGTSNSANVYLYNPATQTNRLISTVASSPTVGAGSAYFPTISGDGSTVVYVSQASDVVSGQTGPASVDNLFRYDVATGRTALVSGAFGSATATGNGDSGQPFAFAVSRDGQFIAFASQATNLVPGQTGAAGNVFLYNARSPGLQLLSGVNGSATAGAGGTSESVQTVGIPAVAVTGTNGVPGTISGDGARTLSISDDGSLVAFVSQAGNLVAGQTTTGPAGTDNVFLYNRTTGRTSLVSGAGGSAGTTAAAASALPVLSGDGSVLAFDSLAYNLTAGVVDGNGVADVFTYVPGGPGAAPVSRSAFQAPPAPGNSYSFSTSADGRYTVFTSTATDLVPNQVSVNTNQNVFLYDRQSGTVALVNHVPGFTDTTGDGGLAFSGFVGSRPPAFLAPAVSADGSWVVFTSQDDNLVPGESLPAAYAASTPEWVYRYNVQTGQVSLVSHDPGSDVTLTAAAAYNPVVSADGRYVAYVVPTIFGHSSGTGDYVEGGLVLYDSAADTATLIVPASSSGPAASSPVVSDDGRFVAYEENDNQVHVFDRTTGQSSLVSHAAGAPGVAGNGTSNEAVISHDGSTIAFVSNAFDLVSNQPPVSLDNVFLYDVATGLVRLASGILGSATTGGNANSDSPALGLDGRYVTFRSDADLTAGPLAEGSNIYEFDAVAGTQTLVSHVAGDPATGAGAAIRPVIDDDGHLVSYVSAAGDLVPGQTGPAGVQNVFVWLRDTNANILASGQGGSPTVGGNADSDFPLLTRHSFPGFSSKATNLVPGAAGSSVAYLNTLVALALSANVIADGSGPGSLVGYLTVSSLLAGQYLPPRYQVPGAGGTLFAVGAAAGGSSPLLTRFLASHAAQASYQVTLLVDVGFGFDPVTFQILVAAPPASPPPAVGPRPITARLVPVRTGKKRKTTRLMVEVFYADTGALKDEFLSPFQKGAFTNILVTAVDANGDGMPDQVVLTARKGRRKVRSARPG